ncbi:MAG: polysaccharide biosynthesis C-terminal domain-containing protein [Lachnospiraceae bacterium]|nr:polysaccharide biosynthesis C-terminal domain-containing protein [Lachnospiraceae bacterium]
MSEKARLIKNTGIIAIGSFSTRIVSFLLLPLYTALLSASEYGDYDYIISVCTFVIPFITVLMEEGIFRFLLDCKTFEEKKEVISIGTVLVGGGTIVFLLITGIIFSVIDYTYAGYFVLYTISCVSCAIINPVLRGMGNVKGYAVYNFLLGAITVVLNVVFIALFRLGLQGMLFSTIIAHYGIAFIMAIYMKIWKYISIRSVSLLKMREMLKYSIPLIPNKISWSIINLCDRIMIMNIVGSAATGVYAIAYKFPNLMDMVYGFFYQSWKESSARVLADGGADEFYNSVYEYLKKFMFSIVMGMTAFMPIMFKLLINESYIEALQYVPILLVATYFANISGFYGGIFTAYKDTKIMGTTTIVAAIINFVINIVAIWKIGIYAAALSTLISNFVVYIYRRIKVKKYIVLNENAVESVVAWGGMALVLILFYINTFLSIVIACLFSIIFAVILNWKMIVEIWSKMVLKKV